MVPPAGGFEPLPVAVATGSGVVAPEAEKYLMLMALEANGRRGFGVLPAAKRPAVATEEPIPSMPPPPPKPWFARGAAAATAATAAAPGVNPFSLKASTAAAVPATAKASKIDAFPELKSILLPYLTVKEITLIFTHLSWAHRLLSLSDKTWTMASVRDLKVHISRYRADHDKVAVLDCSERYWLVMKDLLYNWEKATVAFDSEAYLKEFPHKSLEWVSPGPDGTLSTAIAENLYEDQILIAFALEKHRISTGDRSRSRDTLYGYYGPPRKELTAEQIIQNINSVGTIHFTYMGFTQMLEGHVLRGQLTERSVDSIPGFNFNPYLPAWEHPIPKTYYRLAWKGDLSAFPFSSMIAPNGTRVGLCMRTVRASVPFALNPL